MIGSVAAVLACARSVIWPAHPRRTAKGCCAGGTAPFVGWRYGAAGRVQASAAVAESVIEPERLVCQPVRMTLTFPGAPLASEPPATTNYAIDGPRHRLLLHPFPRRVRARFAGEVVLDSARGALLHESNILPRLYVPLEDVRADLLERTDHATHCPFKGDASYWSVRVGDRVAENAVWTYEDPIAEASWLRGLASVYPERMDAWLDEDEEVTGLRDPYHRVDARRSSRRIDVRADGEVIARSERPVVVAETGLALRFYLPREDIVADLRPSATSATCPYKGRAEYWSLGAIEDVAWSYGQPLESMLSARGHVCFDDTKVEVRELARD
jgi:uncharacterized protein (DUF427 family)